MESKLHKAVFLIDPRFIDEPLELNEVMEGEEYIKHKAGDNWAVWQKYYDLYHQKQYPFDGDAFKLELHDDPRMCYGQLTRAKGLKEYALFCIDLLNVNGTSVKLERSFKSVRVIHSQLRRSLGDEVLKMLVMDHANLLAIEKYDKNPIM